MSISTFQEKVFKSGCGVAVLGISAVAMAMGLFYTSCNNQGHEVTDQNQGAIAVQIGEVAIPASVVQQQAVSMFAGQADQSPKMQTFGLAQALQQAVQQAALMQVVKQVGADTSDEALRAARIKQFDESIEAAKQDLIKQKKLKANPTEAEFAAEFKKQYQQTPDEAKKAQLEALTTQLADPAQKQALLGQFGPQLALEKLKQKYTATEAQVKAGYDMLTAKRVLIRSIGKTPAQVDAGAQKVLDDLKSGLSFEQVMDKYSNDAPAPKKKVSESTVQLTRRDLEVNKDMAPLLTLKTGETSGVITVPEGKAIYKLISTKNTAPADFDKNSKKYVADYAQQQASQELQKMVGDVTKSDLVKYPLPGFKAIQDYFNTMLTVDSGAMGDKRKIADEAKAAMGNDNPADDFAALLAWYSAVEDLYNNAKNDPKKAEELRKERIETIEKVLQQTESFSTRMELVTLGIDTKNAELAAQNLLEAARMNSTYDTEGDRRFREITTKLNAMRTSKLITTEQAKLIEDEQERWRAEKVENDKQKKAFEAEQAEQKKKDEVEKKKFDAEQKKMADQVKKDIAKEKGAKPPTTPTTTATTGGTTPATTGGTPPKTTGGQ